MLYESTIYANLAATEVDVACPNILRWVHTYRVASNMIGASTDMGRGIKDMLEQTWKLAPAAVNPIAVHIIVTERRTNVDLLSNMLKKPQSIDTIRAWLFQIVFSLAILADLQVQHNDLHPGNILLDLNPEEAAIFYKMEDHIYRVPTEVTGKIQCNGIYNDIPRTRSIATVLNATSADCTSLFSTNVFADT